MSKTLQFQDPGEGIHDGEVVEIHVSPGDSLRKGEVVLVVETDKANFEVESAYSGRVEKVLVEVGDTIEVGQRLVVLESDGEREQRSSRPAGSGEVAEAEAGAEARQEEAGDAEPRPAGEEPERREPAARPRTREVPVSASPATRRIARELGVDLHEIAGSGDDGRVLAADVRAHASGLSGRSPRETGVRDPVAALPDFSRFGPVDRAPLRSVRRTVARRMSEAWRSIPHVTHVDEADVTELEAFRRRQSEGLSDPREAPSLTVLVVKAVAAVLKEYPRFNASLDAAAEELVYKRYRHIGVAVDTDRGLLVPVVRDVDRKSLRELARHLDELTERARSAELGRDEMAGASFTVTNVGAIGGIHLSPLIDPPQVAILGLGRARLEPRIRDTQGSRLADRHDVRARLVLPLCLGFDHRVNDGADAARFSNRLVELLGDPERFAMSV